MNPTMICKEQLRHRLNMLSYRVDLNIIRVLWQMLFLKLHQQIITVLTSRLIYIGYVKVHQSCKTGNHNFSQRESITGSIFNQRYLRAILVTGLRQKLKYNFCLIVSFLLSFFLSLSVFVLLFVLFGLFICL